MLTNLLSAQLYTYKKFDHKDGINLVALLSAAEDDNGYLWFGTDGAGLTRYDGQEFTSFTKGNTSVGVNEHVTYIQAISPDSIVYASEYSGINVKHKDTAESLVYIPGKRFSRRGVFLFNQTVCALTDRGFQLVKNNKILAKYNFENQNSTSILSECTVGKMKLIFTNKGAFVISKKSIEPLNEWLSTSKDIAENYIHAINYGDSLKLFDQYLENEIIVLMDEERPKFFVSSKLPINPKYTSTKKTKYLFSDHRDGISVFVSDDGSLKKFDGKNFSNIANNSSSIISSPTDVLIDRNGSFWITSQNDGVFRVSLEPFTRLELTDLFRNPFISFSYRTHDGFILISTFKGKSFLGKIYSDDDFIESEYRISNVARVNDYYLLATSEGLKKLKNGVITDIPNSLMNGAAPRLVKNTGEEIIVLYHKMAPQEYDKQSGKISSLNKSVGFRGKLRDKFVYSHEVSYDSTKLYVGTNNGLYFIDLKEKTSDFVEVKSGNIGSYIGTSTIDIYGTRWFTADRGLIAILKDNSVKTITDPKFFNSTLFYTINSDAHGNLFIGTNEGINVLSVDSLANPIANKTYNQINGFEGYETHMNSQFQLDFENLFVGTVEGLYLIKPEYLLKSEKAFQPLLIEVKNEISESSINTKINGHFDETENNLYFKFKTVNPGNNYVLYSYRLITDKDSTWSEWSDKNEAFFNNLPDATFSFEVRSSFDGSQPSEITSYTFTIHLPFYKTKWFLLIGILLLVILNLVLLERTKKFKQSNIIVSKDMGVGYKTAGALLIFGALANSAAHLIAPVIDSAVPKSTVLTITVGLSLVTLFFILQSQNQKKRSQLFLRLAMLLVLTHNYFLLFDSSLHPFYIVGIILYGALFPIIFNTIRQIISIGLVQMFISVIATIMLDSTVYNEVLFLVGVSLSVCISILITYLRNESLEKLIFTSGVVNKGNNLVVAFNQKGNLTYMSENHEDVIDVDLQKLIGKPISTLNDYQPKSDLFTEEDLAKDFQHGKVFKTPIVTKSGEIVWYQWSCNEFSEDVKVVIGQDITEKISLESYYELIVETADDFIYQCDIKGRITFANEKMVQLIGEEKEDILGRNFIQYLEPANQEATTKFYTQHFRDKTRNTYHEFMILNKHGEKRWIGQNVTIIYDITDNKKVKGFLAIARDITNRIIADTVIKEQNDDITASINYARRIQFNLLPQKKHFKALFEESFVYYKPKDIVSGDFFWVQEVDEKIVVICSDCTGHGVPGAFMTLLGFNLINQIVSENQTTDPGEILNKLNTALIEVLPRDGKDKINDGMETSVLTFEKGSSEVSYSLAGAKFTVARKEGIEIIKGNNKHIGDENEAYGDFETSTINISKNETIYLYSDGYFDQFGGARNKKMTSKRFNALLNSNKENALQSQREEVKNFLHEWMGSNAQTDDITVIGLKHPWGAKD